MFQYSKQLVYKINTNLFQPFSSFSNIFHVHLYFLLIYHIGFPCCRSARWVMFFLGINLDRFIFSHFPSFSYIHSSLNSNFQFLVIILIILSQLVYKAFTKFFQVFSLSLVYRISGFGICSTKCVNFFVLQFCPRFFLSNFYHQSFPTFPPKFEQ